MTIAAFLACVVTAPVAVGQAGQPDFKQPDPASTPRPPSKKPEPGAPSGDPRSTPGAPGTVDLRPKFAKGQELRYVLEQDALNRIKAAGRATPDDASIDQDQKLNQRIGLVMRVTESGPDGATIQVVYDSIKMRMTTPEGVAEFDSAKGKTGAPPSNPANPGATPPSTWPKPTAPTHPTTRPGSPASSPGITNPPAPAPTRDGPPDPDMSDMLGQIVGPMVGQTITVKTDANGKITGVSGGEGLGGSMGAAGGMGGSMVPPPSTVANWLIGGTASAKPAARVGESWTDDSSLAGTPIGGLRMTTTHTLESARAGLASLRFNGHIEKLSEGGPMGIAQIKDSSYRGTYQWDTRAGALREMAGDMNVSMDANIAGTAAQMTSQSKMRVTLENSGSLSPAREPWKRD